MSDWVFYLLWLVVVLVFAGPALRKAGVFIYQWIGWQWSDFQYQRKVRSGKWPYGGYPTCTKCGYDLRSSPVRCPECGQELPPMDSIIVHYLMRVHLGNKDRKN